METKRIELIMNHLKKKPTIQMERIIQKDFDIDIEFEHLKIINSSELNSRLDFSEKNKKIFEILIHYFHGSPKFKKSNIVYELNKGIMLASSNLYELNNIMKLFSIYTSIKNLQFQYFSVNAEEIIDIYCTEGLKELAKFRKPIDTFNSYIKARVNVSLLITGMGTETEFGKHFGVDVDVLRKIIEYRHELINKLTLTHATTNLTTDELKKRYGNIHYKKITEMFNYVPLI